MNSEPFGTAAGFNFRNDEIAVVAVHRCICRDVPFHLALAEAVRHGCGTVAALQKVLDVGTGCGLCVPYLQRVLMTGEIDLPVLGEEERKRLQALAGPVQEEGV